jgi:heme exporter protein D
MAELIPLVFSGGWASGINPYLVVLLTGLTGRLTDVPVPDALMRTDVLIAAAVLTAIDFIVDKTAYLDSTWDAVNTAIRPVAGVALSLLISGDATSLQQAVLAALGGTTALASHATKTGTRIAVNTSPEPVSNIVVSLLEDVAVFLVTLLAFVAPWLAAAIAFVLLALGIVVVVLFWKAIARYRRSRQQRRQRKEP